MRHKIALVSLVIVVAAVAVGLAQAPQGPPPGGRAGGPPHGRGGPFPRVPALPFPTSPQVFDTIHQRIRVVPFVRGLAAPWSMAFLPNGDMLVTEKPGRLRIVRSGVLDPQPITGVPPVFAAGQGGLLEVALHPRFAENRWVYLTYSKPGDRGNTTALLRARFDGNALADARDIFVAEAWSQGQAHFGSKLAFGRDGMLYMTVGERNERNRAQDLGEHTGKVLRLRDDGTAPPDNPFASRAGAKPEIYSYGHRNLQALSIHPDTGELWEPSTGRKGATS